MAGFRPVNETVSTGQGEHSTVVVFTFEHTPSDGVLLRVLGRLVPRLESVLLEPSLNKGMFEAVFEDAIDGNRLSATYLL